jgi:hypothetical protein
VNSSVKEYITGSHISGWDFTQLARSHAGKKAHCSIAAQNWGGLTMDGFGVFANNGANLM